MILGIAAEPKFEVLFSTREPKLASSAGSYLLSFLAWWLCFMSDRMLPPPYPTPFRHRLFVYIIFTFRNWGDRHSFCITHWYGEGCYLWDSFCRDVLCHMVGMNLSITRLLPWWLDLVALAISYFFGLFNFPSCSMATLIICMDIWLTAFLDWDYFDGPFVGGAARNS